MARWQARPDLRFVAGYAGLQVRTRNLYDQTLFGVLTPDIDSSDASPHHLAQLRTYVNLPGNLEFDSGIYYMGRRNGSGITERKLSGHWRLDLRLGWKPAENLELSLVGQDVTTRRRTESTILTSTNGDQQIERAFYGKVTWRY